ncbi:MAG: hypothetical protein BGO70_01150 [Bacteroidetes bacterium 43-93]|uniref:hypothetical protein n=1 Tax=uncultured Dysgonomonas sp. TaxID=206096 RepID=UPI00092BFF54|nr:hypothetical protein [uncultured Dysgonomonas sp.]MBN9483116.1 hypothetical protein [Bacteroidota bacterium]OJW96319.1 MAG: hypothetical protein BGO70_01150 [Bacteroidetes bacterium 43-93]
MNNADKTYKFFLISYNDKSPTLAGKKVFEILSTVFSEKAPLHPSWEFKLEDLFQFLHHSGFVFDSAETFYNLLAAIAYQIQKKPDIHWKELLTALSV